MDSRQPSIRVDTTVVEQIPVLDSTGTLDSSTYSVLRNEIVKAALDEPHAVVVDISRLHVPSTTALAVFTSARWHVSTWPDVPILLVCESAELLSALNALAVPRYVPVFATRESALEAVAHTRSTVRRRARTQLPATSSSATMARTLINEWLTEWGQPMSTPTASTVATIFIENVLAHTDSAPWLILEKQEEMLTIAVEDASHQPASRHEDGERGSDIVSGLAIVAALSRVWGSTPTSSGKTVWAVIGPENLL